MQRDVARFENRSDADSELLSAGVAFLQTGTNAAFLVPYTHECASLTDSAAMRTHYAIWPNDAFQLGERGGFVMEVRSIEDAVWHSRALGHG
jgi:hypothetical protein